MIVVAMDYTPNIEAGR